MIEHRFIKVVRSREKETERNRGGRGGRDKNWN